VIEKIALKKQVPLVDLRGEFLMSGNVKDLLCEDGTHPNTLGQKVITSCLQKFANSFIYA
jgi:lysophospholipase L1-like esterase